MSTKDKQILSNYLPANYNITGSQLSKHLQGIDDALGAITGETTAISTLNSAENPMATTGDQAETGIFVGADVNPRGAGKGKVTVYVNGLQYDYSNGFVDDSPCYFSDDSGATAKAIDDVALNDQLIWNSSIAGFDLSDTDFVSLVYTVFGGASNAAQSDIISSESELLALPDVTLVGSDIQVSQSFRVKGKVTIQDGRKISILAPGIRISSYAGGELIGKNDTTPFLTSTQELEIQDMVITNTTAQSVATLNIGECKLIRTKVNVGYKSQQYSVILNSGTAEIIDCEIYGGVNVNTPDEVLFDGCIIDTINANAVRIGAGTGEVRLVNTDILFPAIYSGIRLTQDRPLYVSGCVFKGGDVNNGGIELFPGATTTFYTLHISNNITIGALNLINAFIPNATTITLEYSIICNNSVANGSILKAWSLPGTGACQLYDFNISGNKTNNNTLIDNSVESTASIGMDIFDGVIGNNHVVSGANGILYHQRKACTTRWKEITVTGNNFESGGMLIDAGSNYAETCSFVGNSIGSGKYLFIHSHPSNTSNSSSFSGNSLESGGKLIEIRYPGTSGGLLRTSTIDGNALISGTLITVTGTVVNPILQNCAINGNIALTALSGASPFDNTTMGSNTEARGNYGVKDFGPGIVGDWNNLTLLNGFAGEARWRYLDGKARVEFEYYLNVGGPQIPLNTVFAMIPIAVRPYVGSLSFMGGNKQGQAGDWHILNINYYSQEMKIIQYGATVANEPQDVQGTITWNVG